MAQNWLPLESNPEVLNDYLKTLSFDTSKYAFTDLYSTEDWAKEMIPQPVLALLLVFPYNDNFRAYRKQEAEDIKANGQFVDPGLFYMKQLAPNACGSVGIYHILGNLQGENKKLLADDSIAYKFLEEARNKSVQERAETFINSSEIRNAHVTNVEKGDTQVVEKVDSHFVALTNFNGNLYEYDGTKESAINHGKTSQESFLDDACAVVQKFMQRDPENIGFSILVLAKTA